MSIFIYNSTKYAFEYGIVPATKHFAYPVIKNIIYPFLKHSSKTKFGKSIGLLFMTYTTTRIGYVYGTGFRREITITNTMNQIGSNEIDGKNEYIICDNNDNIYKIRNCPLRFQFKSPELYMKLTPNQKYIIKGYGWRIGPFGIYPNITNVKSIKN